MNENKLCYCVRKSNKKNKALKKSFWSSGFQALMKLRFLMSHCRKNSVRDKVIGRSGFIQRETLHGVWTITEGECSLKMWCG